MLNLGPARHICAASKLTSYFYAAGLRSLSGFATGGTAVLDLTYIALGLASFGLMALYARWAANA